MAASRVVCRLSGLGKVFCGSPPKKPVAFCPRNQFLTVQTVAINTFMQQRCKAHHSFPYPDIRTEETAKKLVVHLDDRGRSLLMTELTKFERKYAAENAKSATISGTELWGVFLYNAFPFIGFGILDNLVMIVAGEYIDATLGAALGISTMAAAALGNLVSDVAGVGTAGYVESLVSKFGVHAPDITPEQTVMWQTRWTTMLGRAIGISLGCLIGMFPLLFYRAEEKPCECDHVEHQKENNPKEGASSHNSQEKQPAAS